MPTLDEWDEIVSGIPRVSDEAIPLRLLRPIRPSDRGQSGAFLGRGSDGKNYWVKPINNRQGVRVCFNELVVSRLGQLIGAPVCDVMPMRVEQDVSGWEFRDGFLLEPGVASASADVPGANEIRELCYRSDDDNARRHAGVLAMALWLGGGDHQWLYAEHDDNRLYSHDHGHFLIGGMNWTRPGLVAGVLSSANVPSGEHGHHGINKAALDEFAEAMESLTAATLGRAIASVPGSWPVPQQDVAALCYFADQRRSIAGVELERVRDAI